jgi:predicted phage terminase large subunit-like protein
MTYSLREQFDALLRTSLFAFTWFVFNLLHPGDSFVPAWHVKAMVRALEEAMAGRIKRLLITIPPRHLKSITASVSLPAFWLGHDPAARIMVASYGADLASKHARDFRAVLSSPEYQRLFPATRIDPRRNTEFEVMTTARGMRKAVSVGGPVTGFGARVLIVDDLMKAADAQSATERQKIKEFYDQTLYSRMDAKAEGKIIAIQQRLHEDDFAGYLIDKGFEHVSLPAIAEEDETHDLPMGLTHTRRKGEALFPEKEPLETLDEIRREIGSYAFGAQYQQNPVPPDGARIRWEWFGVYDEQPPRSELLLVVQSWDTAHSTEPGADFSVCTTRGVGKDESFYLLDVWRRQVDYPTLLRTARELKAKWKADHVVIEKAGVGYALLGDLLKEFRATICAYQPKVDKESRFAAQSAKIESGIVHLPKEAAWLGPFKHELMAFPNGRHDDQVDSVAQFLDWSSRRFATHRIQAAIQGVHPLRRNPTRR